MKYKITSRKSEVRSPKSEVPDGTESLAALPKRVSPKGETRSEKHVTGIGSGRIEAGTGAEQHSAFWDWGIDLDQSKALREDEKPYSTSVPRLQNHASAAPKEHCATIPPLDLEERTAQFGEAIVRFVKKIPRGPATNRLIDQLLGAGTSIGANYAEARDGVSRKDFMNKVGISRKESKETMFFLRMVAAADESLIPEARRLWREAKELNLILGSIWRK